MKLANYVLSHGALSLIIFTISKVMSRVQNALLYALTIVNKGKERFFN